MTTAVMSAVARPLPGAGTLARAGDLVLVVGEGPGADQVLDVFEEAVGAGSDGGALVRRVAALLANDFDGRLPACAVAGLVTDGRLAVLVYGPATAEVEAEDGTTTLTGTDAVTSVNRLIGGTVRGLRLRLPGAGAPSPRLRLGDGVVAAAGIELGASDVLPRSTMDDLVRPRPESSVDLPERPVYVPPPTPPVPAPMDPAAIEAAVEAALEAAVRATGRDDVAEDHAEDHHAEDHAEDHHAEDHYAQDHAQPNAEYEDTPVDVGADHPLSTVPRQAPPPEQEAPHYADAPPYPAPSPYAETPEHDAPVETADAPTPANGFENEARPTLLAESLPTRVPDGDARFEVVGVRCDNGHLNDPRRSGCTQCGLPLSSDGEAREVGQRPSLGALVLDDGSVVDLEWDYILGREPENDPDVVSGSARPLRIPDADGIVSRRHIRVALADWDVLLIDLGSANGTTIELPGDPNAQALAPHQPVVIESGTLVMMGRRWFRFEASGRS